MHYFHGVRPPGVELADGAPSRNQRFFVHQPATAPALQAMVGGGA